MAIGLDNHVPSFDRPFRYESSAIMRDLLDLICTRLARKNVLYNVKNNFKLTTRCLVSFLRCFSEDIYVPRFLGTSRHIRGERAGASPRQAQANHGSG
jgi:hypothetical protein